MSERRTFILSRYNRAKAILALDAAPDGWAMDLRPKTRSDEQNRALHGLVGQIMKQRTHHNGLRMDLRKWKAMFVQALGEEVEFIPTLDGSSVFPLGLSTREMPTDKFSALIELILAWATQEGLTVKHFDDPSFAAAREGAAVVAAPVAA